MYIVLKNVVILFVLIFLGYFLGKKEIVHNHCAPDLSNFLVKVTLPATVFCSMIRPFQKSLLSDSVELFVIVIIFHLLCMLIGFAVIKVCKIPSVQTGVWIFVCMFSNNGFMGFPLAESIYGNNGLFLMAIANVVSNFLIFSLGVKLLTGGQMVDKLSGRQLFYNNINIAVVFGLVFYFTQWQLPEIILTILKDIGGLTASLSMIVVGLSLSKSKVKEMFQNKKIYLLTSVRLLLVPFITIFITRLIPFGNNSMIQGLLILMSALPAASTVSIITEQYHKDTEAAAQAIFMTTLFSLITIPLVMYFV
ncbi:AEC family transporter [Clostridium arbusti]|uniref:AEC family transporter n=1 Tax=Clostridium arbusti TaxID=1137848 RepID=UPI000288731A|nr:AEC family transporter [Clostridium arbusti]